VILTHVTETAEEFRKTVERLIANGDVRQHKHYVCAGGVGIVFVPRVSSRHVHIHYFINFRTADEFLKAVTEAKAMGFEVFEKCTAMPEK